MMWLWSKNRKTLHYSLLLCSPFIHTNSGRMYDAAVDWLIETTWGWKKRKITRAFTSPEKDFFFMMWLWSKKQNAPLFTTFVVTCIHVPSLRYTRGLGWRMHCGVEVTESSTNKQHHPLHNFCVYIHIHILYFRARAGSGLRAWCMCCGCRV